MTDLSSSEAEEMELDFTPVQFDPADFRIRRKARLESQFYGCSFKAGSGLLFGVKTHGGVSPQAAKLMCHIERQVPGSHSQPDISQLRFIPTRRQLRRKGHTELILIRFKSEQSPDQRRNNHGRGPYLMMAASTERLIEIA